MESGGDTLRRERGNDVALFSWQRIDPTPAEVAAAVLAARRAAGRREPTVNDAHVGLGRIWHRPFGSIRWGSADRGKRRQVAAFYWTDHSGRKHWHVEGDQYAPHGEPNPDWRCRREVVFPLCVIDPLHAVVREGDGGAILVVCDCGEVGAPEALGWSGDCCGPCHDRRAEGQGVSGRVAVHAHRTTVNGLAFTEGGLVLSVGYRDGSVHRFDPRTGEARMLVEPSGLGGAGVAALPGGRAAVAFIRAQVVCLDVDTGEQLWRAHCAGEVMGLAASPAGDWLAVDMVDVPYFLEAATGKVGRGPDDTSEFAFGPDGTVFASDSDYGGVVAVRIREGEIQETGLEFDDSEEDVCFGLACSPADGLVAVGGEYGGVRLGDPETGRWLHQLGRSSGMVTRLAFTPDGDTLASGHSGAVVFWDVRAGRERGGLALPIGGTVTSLAFSPDGETLAVGDEQGVVRLWPWRRLLSVNRG
jgi:hypothetical protein